MDGGAVENDPDDVRPPPPSQSPPIAPPSSPAKPTGLARRLLGSIRALASRPAPPPAAPKVGLGLLLHLRPDHPRLHPAPSASAPKEDATAAPAARPPAAAATGPRSPLNRYRLGVGGVAATSAPANVLRHLKPADTAGDLALGDGRGQDDRSCASDKSGASERENLAGGKEEAGEQQGAVVRRQATSFFKDVDAAGGDRENKVRTGDQLRAARDGDQERDAIHPRDGATCCGIAAEDDQEKVKGRTTDELGSAEKDHEVVGQSVIPGIETHAAIDVQDQQNGVDATVNGSDRGIGKKKKVVKLPYPQRPGKLNCPSYMEKGSCSFGFSCYLHHPPLKARPDSSRYPSEQGNHGVADILELNRNGLPIREGARNCTYYMRNGACRYGKHCHFNHPEHVIDAQFWAPTGWENSTLELEKSSDHHTTFNATSHLKRSSDNATLNDTSYSNKSSYHANLDDTSYSKKSSDHATIDHTSSSSEVLPPNILRMLLPPQKVLPDTEGKVMQVKKDSNWSSASNDSDGCCSADSSVGPLCKQEHVDYPERPGRPECPYYMRSGDCKFASACNYHHPKYKDPTRYHPQIPSLGGEQTEYPERPGEPECAFYMKNWFCKFGAKCWFNHPKDSNPTVQRPRDAKKYVTTDQQHQSTKITLQDHMPQQQQYPERPGQQDCRYYMQFGKCKFLSACIFHHPRDRLRVGWNPSGPAYSDQIGPEIHDMPECPFYVKSGKCHFGSACEFRHPKDIWSTTKKQEQTMYPERPGEPPCMHYMSHGFCKFQMNCKYHHPADRLSRKQYDSTYH